MKYLHCFSNMQLTDTIWNLHFSNISQSLRIHSFYILQTIYDIWFENKSQFYFEKYYQEEDVRNIVLGLCYQLSLVFSICEWGSHYSHIPLKKSCKLEAHGSKPYPVWRLLCFFIGCVFSYQYGQFHIVSCSQDKAWRLQMPAYSYLTKFSLNGAGQPRVNSSQTPTTTVIEYPPPHKLSRNSPLPVLN